MLYKAENNIQKDNNLHIEGIPKRRSNSQVRAKVLDDIIGRKWDQKIIEESLTSKALQGFYEKTRILSQTKARVDLKTSRTDSYHFHRLTQVLPGRKLKINQKYFGDLERKRISTENLKRRVGSVCNEARPSISAKRIIFLEAKKPQYQYNYVNHFLGMMRNSFSQENIDQYSVKEHSYNPDIFQNVKEEQDKVVISPESFKRRRIK